MLRPVSTAACALLAGALWVSAASAAPASTPTPKRLPLGAGVLVDRTGHVVNLNLGGVGLPSMAQDGGSLRAKALDVSRGVQVEFAHGRNWDALGNLFPAPSTLGSAFLSGTHTFSGASFALGNGLSFSAGHSVLGLGALAADQPSAFSRELAERLGAESRQIGTTSASLNWSFTDWADVALTASRTTGSSVLLGSVTSAIGAGSVAETASLGISARVGFGEGWVTTVSYSEGLTQLDLSRDLKLGNTDALYSQAYGIGLAKQGLFGEDDALGIAISRPLQVYSGAGLPLNSSFALANMPARESDVALGYVTTFLDGSLALQANAAYQLNAAGAKGQNAVTGVARAKLNF